MIKKHFYTYNCIIQSYSFRDICKKHFTYIFFNLFTMNFDKRDFR